MRFERLEKMQMIIGNKLDKIQDKFIKSEDGFNLLEDEYKLKCDLDELMSSNNLDDNYLKFYETLSRGNKKINCVEKTRDDKVSIKEYLEKGVETEDLAMNNKKIIVNEQEYKKNIKISSSEPNIKKPRVLIEKNLLNNELIKLNLKLNKIKSKNNLFQNILKNNQGINNCKFMDKIITGFIENLVINWNEIVNLLIDEILEEEIFNLNEMELYKLEKEKYSTNNKLNYIENPSCNSNNENILHDKNSLYEINKLISNYKEEENEILNKYIKINLNSEQYK